MGIARICCTVDPFNDAVFAGMIQRIMGSGMPNLEVLWRAPAYRALVDPASKRSSAICLG